ncbi:MAG: hypothetical protein ACLFVO_26735 [Chloroflexaceae bacterium]
MTQTVPFEQIVELAQHLSPVDKVRLIEYLLPAVRQDIAALAATQNGELLPDRVRLPDAATPEQVRAALELLRTWREAGDTAEQQATLAELRNARPEDFPDATTVEP